MAFIRNCFVISVTMLSVLFTNAQTISYPPLSSQLLKSTAVDGAMLLQKAITGSQFTIATYSSLPSTGIIFIYDSSITNNQACRVESDGENFIRFTASQDNGLCFGFYQYLQQLGFRFYQPGSIWEIIPSLSSSFKKTDTVYSSAFKYNTWFISGGHNRWAMDNNSNYGWETYAGENGHNWALYQRRNGMMGEYRFEGHRSGILTGDNMATWQNNPCYVASFNNSRAVTEQSVPDVNSHAAMSLWASTIEQKYTQYRNSIINNSAFYVNQFRSLNYYYRNIGIEVPDGANWGNSANDPSCNLTPYTKESDQHFTLSNYTAQKISAAYPNSRFQIYAYSTHADVPSASIPINSKLDIQLVPAVYQNITSTNGLRNRWYNRSKNVSEYNYLNLADWSGETPAFYLDAFKATTQIAKDKKSQGLIWEASPAKFASLPYLLAANKSLIGDVDIDKTLREFCDNMFANAGKTIYDLMQFWADSKNMGGGLSNRYKVPLYLKALMQAEQEVQLVSPVVKERLQELKAYLHYMVLYYNWAADQRTHEQKATKAAELCIYLAKINKMQLVNSYYLVSQIARKYATTSSFYLAYNPVNGTAYQNGNLPQVQASDIENNFKEDKAKYLGLINASSFEPASAIMHRFEPNELIPQKTINVQLSYTSGLDFYNRCEFFIQAPAAGSFTIKYAPTFDMPGKGYLNFLVESADKALEIVEDFTIDQQDKAGSRTISLPAAGTYKMTICSKYKTSVELQISTNKNFFYKAGAFFGKTTELYTNNKGIPGYFYIPAGINRVYFSIGNSYNATTGFAAADKISNAFSIQDNNGKILTARFVTTNDSALFYIDVPPTAAGKFCRVTKKANYDLLFANISNYVWYAEPKPLPCSSANFTIRVVNQKGHCITQLTANASQGNFEWEITDQDKTYRYSNQRMVELPDHISPEAVVTLTNGINCMVTKKIGTDDNYLRYKQACTLGGPMPAASILPVIYPNPSTGVFKCVQNGRELTANQVVIKNAQGGNVAIFNNIQQFNISNVPAGMYWYKMLVKGEAFSGKLIKL